MNLRKKTEYIVIHCSATPPHMDIGADDIRLWHTRDNGWRDIGYHSVIRRDGTIEEGRDYHDTGAHVRGYNHNSVGICLIGGINRHKDPEDNFTKKQWKALKRELRWMLTLFPGALVVGHNELDTGKACPSFDVSRWLQEDRL